MEFKRQSVNARLSDIGEFSRSVNLGATDAARARVYHAVISGNPGSRKDLAGRLGIRPTTVSEVVRDLIEDGFVREDRRLNEGVKGPPEYLLTAAHERLVAIGLYVSSNDLMAIATDIVGTTLASDHQEVPVQADETTWLAALGDLVGRLRKQLPNTSVVTGMSVCLPGSAEHRPREWVLATRWPHIHHMTADRISQASGLRTEVFRLLDAKLKHVLGCLGEEPCDSVVLVHWGYGIGAAVAENGRVLSSTQGGFGEIGHWPMSPQPHRTACRCGSHFCLEIDAALWSIGDSLLSGLSRFHEEQLYEAVPDIARAIDIDTGHREVLEQAEAKMATALAQLYTLFHPDRVLVYGPLTHLPGVLNRLNERARALVPPRLADGFHLEAAEVDSAPAVTSMSWYLVRSALYPALARQTDWLDERTIPWTLSASQ